MNFTLRFCDPFQKDSIDLGSFSPDAVLAHVSTINWKDHLTRMAAANEADIHFSPSIDVSAAGSTESLCISAVGEPHNYEFYIFYKRPKKLRLASGEEVTVSPEHISDITGQTAQDALDCLQAFLRNDAAFLEARIGS